MTKIELLAPAGNLEKLEMAVVYGADAVYLGGGEYSLRAGAENFGSGDMEKGVRFAHGKNRKAYLTVNTIPRNDDIDGLPEYLQMASDIGFDAIILSDPGVLSIVRETCPGMEIHLSTQANTVNWRSAAFWHSQGVKRVILARELSLSEIRTIREKTPPGLDLEIFVHGAMCISYSGRCLLSGYLAGRDPNRGRCAQPCRWKYALVEEKRPGVYMPVYENETGSFILNSKDLCMLQHIPEIASTGVASIKIEGRMKSSYYVATVVDAYRRALDAWSGDPGSYSFDPMLLDEVSKASHREFTTGFYFERPSDKDRVYRTAEYVHDYDFVGLVRGYDERTGIATVEQRNRMFTGEDVEVVMPGEGFFIQKIKEMKNADGEIIESAPHPQMTVFMPIGRKVPPYSILRRRCNR